jgi:hypothetical protein
MISHRRTEAGRYTGSDAQRLLAPGFAQEGHALRRYRGAALFRQYLDSVTPKRFAVEAAFSRSAISSREHSWIGRPKVHLQDRHSRIAIYACATLIGHAVLVCSQSYCLNSGRRLDPHPNPGQVVSRLLHFASIHSLDVLRRTLCGHERDAKVFWRAPSPGTCAMKTNVRLVESLEHRGQEEKPFCIAFRAGRSMQVDHRLDDHRVVAAVR